MKNIDIIWKKYSPTKPMTSKVAFERYDERLILDSPLFILSSINPFNIKEMRVNSGTIS